MKNSLALFLLVAGLARAAVPEAGTNDVPAAAAAPAPAPVPVPRKWEYIVIHHSATSVGNAETFDASHRARGMNNGLAYHFVIDNGTDGMADGHIETGERWKTQLHGGHCRQSFINDRGIGICLVGDFSHGQPTAKQLEALALLVRGLQEQFKIPDDKVLGHGEVIGEFSECPGKDFPWDDFKRRLRTTTPHPDPLPQGARGGQKEM